MQDLRNYTPYANRGSGIAGLINNNNFLAKNIWKFSRSSVAILEYIRNSTPPTEEQTKEMVWQTKEKIDVADK